MKQKGFTLIELLAVIVVLAIIAIIAVPLITNVIDKAKQGALKDSAYGILDAAEIYLAKNMSEGIDDTIEFTCSNGKCINGEKEISYKGQIETGRIRIYSDSKIELCITDNKYSALKKVTEKEVQVETGTCKYEELSYDVSSLVSKDDYDKLYDKYVNFRNGIISKIDSSEILSNSTDESIISSISTGGYVALFSISDSITKSTIPIPITYYNTDFSTLEGNSIIINKSGKYRVIAHIGHSPYGTTNTSFLYLYLNGAEIGRSHQNYMRSTIVDYEFTVNNGESAIVNCTIYSDISYSGNRSGVAVVIKES